MPPPATHELVLHVGMGKTGTSTIQFFLRDHRDDLARRDVLMPQTPGRARHAKIGLFAKDDAAVLASPEWPRIRADSPTRFRRRVRRRLLDEVAQADASRVLLSDEVLFMQPPEVLSRLRSLTDEIAQHTRLVLYLRRQDDHMVSRYQQGVKIGWTQRLSDWVDTEDMSHLYDYAARLRLHRRVLEPAALVVRRYEPASFVRGSLVSDFLDACDIDLDLEDASEIPDRNLSLDAESVEFLRLLNLHLVRTTGATPGQIDHRALVSRLAPGSDGPTLSLPRDRLDEWRRQWADGNRSVASELFPGEELFDVSPPTRPVVTEQSLDPARVDDLATVAGVTDEQRAGVRRLAEEQVRGGRSAAQTPDLVDRHLRQ